MNNVCDPTQTYSDYECRVMLRNLYNGDSVVIPTSEQHAKYMLMIAQKYLDDRHAETFRALAQHYG